MTGLALLKRNWLWVGVVVLCALISFAAFVAPSKIGEMELEREASVASDRIGAMLRGEPGALIDAFSRPALAPHLARVFEGSSYGHRVLRYELYDKAGNLTFTSGKAGLQLDRTLGESSQPKPSVTAGIELHNRSDSAVSHFAMLTIPVRMANQPDATLLVYLDQSDQAKLLSRYFGLIAAVTLLLLGAGVATPLALAWMRSQEREIAEARMRYLQDHDPLTELPNRQAFSDSLADALPTMNRNRKHIAVLCLDVDKFKDINDASDIATGDAVLREMGARIQSILRSGDFVARRSGDEFAIALVDINNLAEVMAFTNRLMDTLRPSFRVADKEFPCTT
ncbi:MAG: GGDEF domain-containing protein, partial [Methyloceanibacter sp.]